MSRRKRGRTQTPPPNESPRGKNEPAGAPADDALRLQLGGGGLASALTLEIGVGAVPAPERAGAVDPPPEPAPEPAQADLLAPLSATAARGEDGPVATEDPPSAPREPRQETEHHIEAPPPSRPLGLRFADARAALGLSIEEAARRLRVPAPVVCDIEAERFQALGAPIYARGFLKSYARLVQLPESALNHALEACAQTEPDLLPAVGAQPRALVPRFATPALYALLTLLLVVPVALQLYQRGNAPTSASPADRPARELALDVPDAGPKTATGEVPAGAAPAAGQADDAGTAPATVAAAPPPERRPPPSAATAAAEPMLASLAPMPARSAASTGQHVVLKLTDPSWVELTGVDGSRIEYAMLPAGTVREYQVSGKASLRIGNTRGASLFVDGRPIDLSSFARANVARVALGEESPAAAEAQ